MHSLPFSIRLALIQLLVFSQLIYAAEPAALPPDMIQAPSEQTVKPAEAEAMVEQPVEAVPVQTSGSLDSMMRNNENPLEKAPTAENTTTTAQAPSSNTPAPKPSPSPNSSPASWYTLPADQTTTEVFNWGTRTTTKTFYLSGNVDTLTVRELDTLGRETKNDYTRYYDSPSSQLMVRINSSYGYNSAGKIIHSMGWSKNYLQNGTVIYSGESETRFDATYSKCITKFVATHYESFTGLPKSVQTSYGYYPTGDLSTSPSKSILVNNGVVADYEGLTQSELDGFKNGTWTFESLLTP